jgi:hypothetical protein
MTPEQEQALQEPDIAILLAEHTLSIFTRFDYTDAK